MSTVVQGPGGSRPTDSDPAPLGQGVIDDANRHRRARRRRSAVTLLLALVVAGGIAWALAGGSSGAQTPAATAAAGARASADAVPRFGVRLAPTLEVGHAGWCVVVVENGVTGGSACGGVLAGASPFLQIYGWGPAHSHRTTQVAVTAPQVLAVQAGSRRVPTISLPGLPFGLRAVRVVTAPTTQLRALDALGRPLPDMWPPLAHQATVRRWRAPSRAPRGVCSVRVSGLAGFTASNGAVATSVRPFPGRLVGSAFLPCALTTLTRSGVPINVTALIDAASPGSPPAALPDFHAVRSRPGVFSQGGLVATRDGAAWLVVSQGSGVAQRLELLAHASALISIPVR